MKKYFFASDTHLGHYNILKYDNRPFDNIIEHDETIIKNWNSIISDIDDVYFLGDFSFVSKTRTEEFLKRLNGIKFFIKGNHDKKDTILLYKKYGTYLGQLESIEINNQLIILCHYSMNVWDRSHFGSWCLFGHSHGNLPENPNSLTMDTGINTHNYFPYEFEEIKTIMKNKTFIPLNKRDRK